MWNCPLIRLLTILAILHKGLTFVKVTNLQCKYNDELCSQTLCTTTKNARGTLTFINFGCNFKKPIDKVTARITLYRKRGKNYELYFLDTEENICEVLKNVARNQVFAHIFDTMLTRLRSLRCPFEGNITMTKVPVLLNLPPGIFSDSHYMIGAHVHKGDYFVFGTNITFVVEKLKYKK